MNMHIQNLHTCIFMCPQFICMYVDLYSYKHLYAWKHVHMQVHKTTCIYSYMQIRACIFM